MILTDEQQAILSHPPTATIKVAAGAGCGKTSMLVEYGRRWPAAGLYLAFNKSIADDARRKFPATIQTRTAHSYAYRALEIGGRPLIGKFRVEHLKAYSAMIRTVPGLSDYQTRAAIVRTLDNFMIDGGSKILPGHCPLDRHEHRTAVRIMAGDIAAKLLRFQRHDLPITHDVYLKAFEMWHRIEGFDYLLLDEAQDLNPVLVSIARKAAVPTIVVGDSYQSIYRFRGAIDAMAGFAVDQLPLSQSWRFGGAIATAANRILRHHSKPPQFELRGNPARDTIIMRANGRAPIGSGTAILARTNARLFDSLTTLARPFHLIGGFTELKRQLLSAHALKTNRPSQVTDASVARFASWHALDVAADRGDVEARRLRDIVDRYGDQLPGLLDRLEKLHREHEAQADIVVSTAHRAKGREWACM